METDVKFKINRFSLFQALFDEVKNDKMSRRRTWLLLSSKNCQITVEHFRDASTFKPEPEKRSEEEGAYLYRYVLSLWHEITESTEMNLTIL